jgi:hypothetical protein
MNSFPDRKQSDYIRVYDNVIPAHWCEEFIDEIDNAPIQHLKEQRLRSRENFWCRYIKEGSERDLYAINLFERLYAMYKEDLDLGNQLPNDPNLSRPKIKRYDMGSNDRFVPHVDVASLLNSHRALGMIVYLNDVLEGGDTIFECREKPVRPVRGRCVLFPPLWMYKHEAIPAVSANKYILQAYARYK